MLPLTKPERTNTDEPTVLRIRAGAVYETNWHTEGQIACPTEVADKLDKAPRSTLVGPPKTLGVMLASAVLEVVTAEAP